MEMKMMISGNDYDENDNNYYNLKKNRTLKTQNVKQVI